jgi:hypothetical protein
MIYNNFKTNIDKNTIKKTINIYFSTSMLSNVTCRSISQLVFQEVVTENLIETNDYKVHNRNVTNELTGQTFDHICDAITKLPSGTIVERFEAVGNKTQNINRKDNITAISNTLNGHLATGRNAVDVIYNKVNQPLLGGDNGPKNYVGMYAPQNCSNIDLLLAADDIGFNE